MSLDTCVPFDSLNNFKIICLTFIFLKPYKLYFVFRWIENKPNRTKFTHQNPERKDTGTYKIVATNKYGTDTAEFEINVISKYRGFPLILFCVKSLLPLPRD